LTTATPPDASPGAGPLRILFSVRPFRGHLHPLIPLARAFRGAGHLVAVATAEDAAAIVASAGLPWFPAGLNPREAALIADDDPDYGYWAVHAKVQDLIDLSIGQFRPDVVIREPTDLAPVIASEVVGAVDVTYGLAHFIPMSSWKYLGADKTITELRRSYRLPDDPELDCIFRGLYLSVLPPPWELFEQLPVPAVQPMRYVPWDGDPGPPPELAPQMATGRRTVLVTLGTVYNTNVDLFERFLAALDDDLDVICTLGEGSDLSLFANAPPNVRFERYRPHSDILPGCQALLCHAGFNTVMGSIVAGVPLVCVPLGSDQEYNARMCAENGLGLFLAEPDATPQQIRSSVRRVLGEPSFTDNVQAFRRQMAKAPSLAAAVRRIEEMVAMERSDAQISFET
jgi:UDP:flavonoid glycosyltransferase YjiC (YdhE family)